MSIRRVIASGPQRSGFGVRATQIPRHAASVQSSSPASPPMVFLPIPRTASCDLSRPGWKPDDSEVIAVVRLRWGFRKSSWKEVENTSGERAGQFDSVIPN